MELTILLSIGIYSLLSFALFLYVLIRLFKAEGALKGILGFFCGIYLFLWGWIKHKEQKITGVMVLWTILIFAPIVASFVMPGIFATMSLKQLGDMNQILTGGQGTGSGPEPPPVRRPKTAKAPKKVKRISPPPDKPAQIDEATRQKSIAFIEKARALWKEDDLTDPEMALKLLNQAVSINPESAAAFNDRGKVHAKMGQFDRALKDYDTAVKLDPDYVRAYNNRGVVLYETNQYDEALKNYNQAIVLNPGYATAYLNRGLANYQMDRMDRACKDFEKACELGDCEGSEWAKKNNMCK